MTLTTNTPAEKVYQGKDAPSNAAKAAKKVLGADAKRGLDFDIIKVKGGAVWRARQLDKAALDQPEAPASKTDVPVATEAAVDAEARKETPRQREAGEAGPALLAKLFPLGGSRRPHPSDAPKTAAAFAGADHFTTFLRLSTSEAIRGKHKTLAEAAARAHMLREQHPGRDVIVYAVSKDFRGGDIPVPREAQREAAAAAINATAPKKPEPKKAAPKPVAPKADRPLGKRAQIEAAARAGKMPSPPDFSAATHERFRPKLAEVVKMAKAGDLKGLRAFKIEGFLSTSPKAIMRYRDLAILALEAKR